ncbi:uncharacterized protein VSU04_014747 [Chlamydotis macqueenii]
MALPSPLPPSPPRSRSRCCSQLSWKAVRVYKAGGALPRHQGEELQGAQPWLCPNWSPSTGPQRPWGPQLCRPQPAQRPMQLRTEREGHQSLLSSIACSRSKTNALNISQKMTEMFVRTKHKIDKCHKCALVVVVNNEATWVSRAARTGTALRLPHPSSSQLSGFTLDPCEVCHCLYNLETVVCKSFSIPPSVGLRQGGDPQGPLGANGVPWVQAGTLWVHCLWMVADPQPHWCPWHSRDSCSTAWHQCLRLRG